MDQKVFDNQGRMVQGTHLSVNRGVGRFPSPLLAGLRRPQRHELPAQDEACWSRTGVARQPSMLSAVLPVGNPSNVGCRLHSHYQAPTQDFSPSIHSLF
jgi:hypothetical protein